MRHIILDTDMGIDDALALFLVLSSLEAITTAKRAKHGFFRPRPLPKLLDHPNPPSGS
jgi:hypothetical protein